MSHLPYARVMLKNASNSVTPPPGSDPNSQVLGITSDPFLSSPRYRYPCLLSQEGVLWSCHPRLLISPWDTWGFSTFQCLYTLNFLFLYSVPHFFQCQTPIVFKRLSKLYPAGKDLTKLPQAKFTAPPLPSRPLVHSLLQPWLYWLGLLLYVYLLFKTINFLKLLVLFIFISLWDRILYGS